MSKYEADRKFVRLLLRTRVGYQDMRKAMDNRIGRKADGKSQNLDNREISMGDFNIIQSS